MDSPTGGGLTEFPQDAAKCREMRSDTRDAMPDHAKNSLRTLLQMASIFLA